MTYTFRFGPVLEAYGDLLAGAWLTLQLSASAMLVGLVLAIICAWVKTSDPKPLRWVIDCYIEVIRNTPFLVQIFFIFFGLPAAGLRLSPNAAALLAMVINVGAYATEIIRAGIESIHKGQPPWTLSRLSTMGEERRELGVGEDGPEMVTQAQIGITMRERSSSDGCC